jgi:hypothetical protein
MRIILATIIKLVVTLITANAQINLNDGLVGHWPFNGNANDESGYENHGLVNGATLTTDRFGKSYSAYFFLGNSTIETTFTGIKGNDDRTISFWVRVCSHQEGGFIFSHGDYICGQLFAPAITYYSETRCNAHLHLNNSWVTYSTSNDKEEKWNHFVFAYSKFYGNTLHGIRVYKNGFLLTEKIDCYNNSNCEINTGTTQPLIFGSKFSWFQNSITIDDVRFYNRILSEQEILTLFSLEEEECS